MGQKVNPISLRLQKTNRFHNSSWYSLNNYSNLLSHDLVIRHYLLGIYKRSGYLPPHVFLNLAHKKVKIYSFHHNPKESRKERRILPLSYSLRRKKTLKPKYPLEQINKLKLNSINYLLGANLGANSYLKTKSSLIDLLKTKVEEKRNNKIKFISTGKGISNKNEADTGTFWKSNTCHCYARSSAGLLKPTAKRITAKKVHGEKKLENLFTQLQLEKEFDIRFFLIAFFSRQKHFSSDSKTGISRELDSRHRQNILNNFLMCRLLEKDNGTLLSLYYKIMPRIYGITNINNEHPPLGPHLNYNKIAKLFNRDGYRKALIGSQNTPELLSNNEDRFNHFFLGFASETSRFVGAAAASASLPRGTALIVTQKKQKPILSAFSSDIANRNEIKSTLELTKTKQPTAAAGNAEPRMMSLCSQKQAIIKTKNLNKQQPTFAFADEVKAKVLTSLLKLELNKEIKADLLPLRPFILAGSPFRRHLESIISKNVYCPSISSTTSTKKKAMPLAVELFTFNLKKDRQCAVFLANEIAFYLKERTSFRRISQVILAELEKSWFIKGFIKGVRITCSGRLGGRSKKAQRSKTESFKFGKTSLHVFSSKIDFACTKALTPFGLVGVKVWISYD